MKIKTRLYSYQQEAVDKLLPLKVGALYMEQGTGKTRTALEIIRHRLEAGKMDVVLWMCPCSVKRNLRMDITYHCGNYPDQIVIRGIESLSSSDRLYLQLWKLVTTHTVMLIVDESNLCKNKDAIRTARLIELAKHCKYRMILNGTPVSKNEADMYAQWYILDWRILGYQSYYSFAANHIEYETITLPSGYEVQTDRIRRVLNVDYLSKKISPYTYQVRKADVLDLPGKTYYTEYACMTDQQEEIYDKTKENYLFNVDNMRSETIYKLFTACQHVASGRKVSPDPQQKMTTSEIFADPEENPRIQALEHIIENRIPGGEKCIIFCKYSEEISEIEDILNRRGLDWVEFTGRIKQKERQRNLDAFREDTQYLLANKMCGAYGLNLQFCHNMIFYSNDFDLATRAQAEDRIHRIGQTHDVAIYDVIMCGTIDTFICGCIGRKENMVEAFKRSIDEWKKKKIEEGGKNETVHRQRRIRGGKRADRLLLS